MEWIAGAKREATRARRIETAIEWLAEGKPRNWKYLWESPPHPSTAVPAEERRSMRTVPILAALLMGATSLSAQTSVPRPGDRVRITVTCPDRSRVSVPGREGPCRTEGILAGVGADSLELSGGGTTRRYGLDAVRALEVRDGTRSHWLIGAGGGLVAGTVGMVAILNSGGSTAPCDRSANQDAISSGACLGLYALGGAGGAGLRALVGSFIRTDRWRAVPLERLSLGPRPSTAGGGVGLVVWLRVP